mmetsp:Transcript_16393/g.46911  ORF Transcript_16393/g.46911 Transcript_16393/m.46911 type:complete len:375 (-) Transcript_16393:414-1538(-)
MCNKGVRAATIRDGGGACDDIRSRGLSGRTPSSLPTVVPIVGESSRAALRACGDVAIVRHPQRRRQRCLRPPTVLGVCGQHARHDLQDVAVAAREPLEARRVVKREVAPDKVPYNLAAPGRGIQPPRRLRRHRLGCRVLRRKDAEHHLRKDQAELPHVVCHLVRVSAIHLRRVQVCGTRHDVLLENATEDGILALHEARRAEVGEQRTAVGALDKDLLLREPAMHDTHLGHLRGGAKKVDHNRDEVVGGKERMVVDPRRHLLLAADLLPQRCPGGLHQHEGLVRQHEALEVSRDATRRPEALEHGQVSGGVLRCRGHGAEGDLGERHAREARPAGVVPPSPVARVENDAALGELPRPLGRQVDLMPPAAVAGLH